MIICTTYFPLSCIAGVSWCCVVCRSDAAQYLLAADDGGGATNERRLVINYGDVTIGDPQHSVHGRCGSIVNIQYMAIHR